MGKINGNVKIWNFNLGDFYTVKMVKLGILI